MTTWDRDGSGDGFGEADRRSGVVGLTLATALSVLVFAFFNWPQPDGWSDLFKPLLFIDTTPSGGDMGAHVWGPAYLRDNLLPQFRLSGWTPDWYAGFPAYHFYMVIPPLAIIAVNSGLPWFIGLPLGLALIGAVYNFRHRIPLPTGVLVPLTVLAATLLVAVPYGVAFKTVSVVGLVLFPVAAWKMGRLAGATEPIPAFLALAAFVFIYDTNFTIYGGNIASTLAGEFSFSICLMLALLAIGMTSRGLDGLLSRTPTAVVIALVALSHVLPVFFLMPALALLVLIHDKVSRAWVAAGTVALSMIPIAFAEGTGLAVRMLAVLAVAVVAGASAVAHPSTIYPRLRWMFLTGPVSILLASFWLVPFVLRRDFFNDMGWERVDHVGPQLLTVPMKIALPVAAIGVLLSYANREKLGMMFTGTGLIFAAAVANVPEGRIWNVRLLPFYYLSVYMLAAIAVALILRMVAANLSGDLRRPRSDAVVLGTVVAAVATLAAVAMPLRIMPLGRVTDAGTYEWLAFSNTARSFLPSWVDWNYSGYEQKESYREYREVVSTMDEIGADRGCGRAMWEHHADLDRYGTPMALMLLPHWTDGCVGSMEGLYFESSASTPFHFLNQSMLSDAPSRPQRNLPYQDFDIDRGVAQLQASGVRYYMAQSDRAILAAEQHPDLTLVGEAQPFVMFEVAGSELVEGLDVQPLVVSGPAEEQVAGFEHESRFEIGWVSQAVEFYNDPNAFPALPAEDGPESWVRSTVLNPTAAVPVDAATVSGIVVDNDRISFSVDQVGSPVLVKASYFPNWNVEGADGPWRAGPNMMVVVPTETEVELHYGRSWVDWLGILLTLAGIGALFGLAAIDRRRPDDDFFDEYAEFDDDLDDQFVDDPAEARQPSMVGGAAGGGSSRGGEDADGGEADWDWTEVDEVLADSESGS